MKVAVLGCGGMGVDVIKAVKTYPGVTGVIGYDVNQENTSRILEDFNFKIAVVCA